MDPVIDIVGAAIFGSFLGTLLFSRLGHWLLGIRSALAARNEGAPTATVFFVALFSSAPWLLAVVILGGYYVLSTEHTAFWDWFFGATAVVVSFWLLFSMSLHLRAKRKTRAATTPAPNKRFQYPVYIRTKRNFVLCWTGLACVLGPVFVWVSALDGTPLDLSITIAIGLIPCSALTGLFIWQIIGPALSTGTRFITRTEPTPPQEPVDDEARDKKAS